MTWPLHSLVLTTPSLVLRGMTETDAVALAAVVPDDLEADPRLAHVSPAADVLQAYWRNAGTWQPTDWVLPFVVMHDGVPIGVQGLEGKDFSQVQAFTARGETPMTAGAIRTGLMNYRKDYGLVANPKRGFYCATQKGIDFVLAHRSKAASE